MDLDWLDSLEFEDVPAPIDPCQVPRVSVTRQRIVAMNPAFIKQVDENRRFKIQLSKDGRCLLLHPCNEGTNCFEFKEKKDHRATVAHSKLPQMLMDRGIQLPASYIMEWCPERNVWVGNSDDLPKPPPASPLPPRKKRR